MIKQADGHVTDDAIIVCSLLFTSLTPATPLLSFPVVLERSLKLHAPGFMWLAELLSSSLLLYSLRGTLRRRHLAKAALVCDARRGDGVIVAGVQDDERINGSSRLMEGGRPTRSLLRGASCNWAGKELSSEAAGVFFMFWMRLCSFLPVRVGMIWMSPARVMLLKH